MIKKIKLILIILILIGTSFDVHNSLADEIWRNVGILGFSDGQADLISLAFDGSSPYVAYQDAANGYSATVMKYDGENWVNVGETGFSAGQANYISLALDGSTPYVAYSDGGNDYKATVMKYDYTHVICYTHSTNRNYR